VGLVVVEPGMELGLQVAQEIPQQQLLRRVVMVATVNKHLLLIQQRAVAVLAGLAVMAMAVFLVTGEMELHLPFLALL
jgi:hypothetical protein